MLYTANMYSKWKDYANVLWVMSEILYSLVKMHEQGVL